MVWTLENLPERLAAIRSVAERFTQATGITVEMVGVDENQFTQLVTASAASGVLPDVVGSLPLAAVRSLAANELLDPAATGQALAALGPETFSARALELTREGTRSSRCPARRGRSCCSTAATCSPPRGFPSRAPTPTSPPPRRS